MRQKYIFCSLCFTVFVICAFNVQVSNSQNMPEKKKKEKKKKDADEDEDSTEKSFIPIADENTDENGTMESGVVQTLEQFLEIPPMPFITYGPYPFEQVDYDLLPDQIYKQYFDCEYWHSKCVRDRVYVHALCAYSTYYGWLNFVNQCELELQNCYHRISYNYGIFGTGMRDDGTFFNGDGWACKYYYRRSVPNDRLSMYFEEEQNLISDIEKNYNGTLRMLDKVKVNSTENLKMYR